MKPAVHSIVLLLLTCGVCRAEAPAFPRGTQDVGFRLGYALPVANDQEQYHGGGVEYAYYFHDNLAIVPALDANYVDSRDATGVLGADFTLSLRWHFFQAERFTLYGVVSPGLAYFDHPIPFESDTRFNFHIGAGLGATYRLCDNLHLIGGADLMHFSNANIEGNDRHHGSNAVRMFVGLLWTF